MKTAFNLIKSVFLFIIIFNSTKAGEKGSPFQSPFVQTEFLDHRPFPVNKLNLTELERKDLLIGIQAISRIEEFFYEKDFDNIIELLTNITDEMFSISSSTTLTTFLSGEISTPEIDSFKKALLKLNTKINQWKDDFNEVRYSIDWAVVNINFESLESGILTVQRLLTRFTDIDTNEREFAAKQFLHSYETDYRAAGDLLYSVMININQDFSGNLFRASQKFTQFYRNQVQIFMVTLVKLLVQAIHIEANYLNLKYEADENVNFLSSIWNERFKALKSTMKVIDLDTKDQFKKQFEIDLDEYLMTRESLTNEQFSQVIYQFLSTKYNWRDWFVVVYAPISGFRDHTVSTCQGTYRFRAYGRNIIVSSVDRQDGIVANLHIERNKQLIASYSDWKSDREYSRGWVAQMGKLLPNCNDADTRVSIAWGSNVWFMNTNLVVYKKNCVNDKSPCFNTFLFA